MKRRLPAEWFYRDSGVTLNLRLMMGSLNSVIGRNPEILGGAAVFHGTRVPFQALLDYLEGGQTIDEFVSDFPTVRREAAVGALKRAKAFVVTELE